jgi:hypothetical protein
MSTDGTSTRFEFVKFMGHIHSILNTLPVMDTNIEERFAAE